MFDETSKWSKSHPIRLEAFNQVESVSKSKRFVEKTSRQKKIPFWPWLAITIKWSVSYLVSCFCKNSQESMTGWIVDPSVSIWSFFQIKHMKIIKHGLRAPEWVPGDKTWIMKTSKKIIKILSLLAKILSRKIVLIRSILVARRQMRTLYSLPWHSARNALKTSRYSGR